MLFHRSSAVLVAAMVVICGAGAVKADVTVEQKVTVDGFGPMKIGAMQGKSVTAIAGDRGRTEGEMKFNSKILRMFTHGAGANNVQIIRLDKELEYQIDPAKKQYSETTFAQMREAMEKNLKSAQSKKEAAPQQAPSGAPVNESECQWSPPKTSVKQGTEHATFAGADAKRVTISVTTTCIDKTKNTSCDFVYLIDNWVAPEMPGATESHEFWRNYGKKLNLSGALAASMQANAQQVFERYKGAWGEAISKAGAIKGYPMKSVFAMQVGGEQCKSAEGSKDAKDSKDTKSSESAPASPSDAVGGFAMGLLNKLHKKPDETPASDALPLAPGMVQLFQMSTETVSIKTDSIPASQFEVPPGFTKVDSAVAKSAAPGN